MPSWINQKPCHYTQPLSIMKLPGISHTEQVTQQILSQTIVPMKSQTSLHWKKINIFRYFSLSFYFVVPLPSVTCIQITISNFPQLLKGCHSSLWNLTNEVNYKQPAWVCWWGYDVPFYLAIWEDRDIPQPLSALISRYFVREASTGSV